MAYSALTFTASEVPTLTKWNQLWANDAAMADGTGIANNAILDRHILTGNLKTNKFFNPYKWSVYRGSAFNVGNGGYARINFDTKNFDTGSNFDNVTNFRMIAPINGFYQVNFAVGAQSAGYNVLALFKNGTEFKRGNEMNQGGSTDIQLVGADFVQLTAGDYLEVFVQGSGNAGQVGQTRTYFSGHLESAT